MTSDRDVLEGGLREAAKRLGKGDRWVYRHAHELPFVVRIGAHYIVPRAAFLKFLDGELKPLPPAEAGSGGRGKP